MLVNRKSASPTQSTPPPSAGKPEPTASETIHERRIRLRRQLSIKSAPVHSEIKYPPCGHLSCSECSECESSWTGDDSE